MRGVPDQRGMLGRHAHLREQQLHRLHDGRPVSGQEPRRPGLCNQRHQCWAMRGVHRQQHLLGQHPVCDTTANKCIQCLTSAGCSGRYAYLHEPGLHRLHHPRPMRRQERHCPGLCHQRRLRAVHGQQHLRRHHTHLRDVDQYLPRVHGRQRNA